jgi:hypothetical protein
MLHLIADAPLAKQTGPATFYRMRGKTAGLAVPPYRGE